jgi:tetratricopeptide (TPR) repeat protein
MRNEDARDLQESLDFEIGFYTAIIEKNPEYVDALSLLGDAYTRKGLYAEGLEIDRRITTLKPRDPIAHYNLACSYSLLQRKKEAIQSLRRSIALGYNDIAHIATDADLAFLRKERSFHRILRRLCRKILKRAQEPRAR